MLPLFKRHSPDVAPENSRDWRQGDVFADGELVEIDSNGRPVIVRPEHGVAIVSQSCDSSRLDRLTINVAPVVVLDESTSKEARGGKRPRFGHLPSLGESHFADFSNITTANKSRYSQVTRTPGVTSDEAVRRFAYSVSRRFGRFAFPDEVSMCLNPLSDVISSKATKPGSPLGSVLKQVHALRINSAPNWENPPYDLTLIVILEAGILSSSLDDDLPDPSPDLIGRSIGMDGKVSRTVTELAQELRSATDAGEVYWLWQYIGQAWAESCDATAARLDLRASIRSVTSEIVVVDEFPLSRVVTTEALDLEHLSPPLPRP